MLCMQGCCSPEPPVCRPCPPRSLYHHLCLCLCLSVCVLCVLCVLRYVRVFVQSIITHNMVIGGRYDAEDLGALRKLGITYVLNITDRIPNYFPDVLIYHKIEIQGECVF
jgi:hypothetical protein